MSQDLSSRHFCIALCEEEWMKLVPKALAKEFRKQRAAREESEDENAEFDDDDDDEPASAALDKEIARWFSNEFKVKFTSHYLSPSESGYDLSGSPLITIRDVDAFEVEEVPLSRQGFGNGCGLGINILLDWKQLLKSSKLLKKIERALPAKVGLITWGYKERALRTEDRTLPSHGAGLEGKFGVCIDPREPKRTENGINANLLQVPDSIFNLITEILDGIGDEDPYWLDRAAEKDWDARRDRIHKEVTPAVNHWLETLSVPPCATAFLPEAGWAFSTYRGDDISLQDVLITWPINETHVLRSHSFDVCQRLRQQTIRLGASVWM